MNKNRLEPVQAAPQPAGDKEEGLADVVACNSAICYIDGVGGRLIYRGHDALDLANRSTFEEVAYLLDAVAHHARDRDNALRNDVVILAADPDRGYGFISRENEDKDLFFHSNELVEGTFDSLREGDKVEFEVRAFSR